MILQLKTLHNPARSWVWSSFSVSDMWKKMIFVNSSYNTSPSISDDISRCLHHDLLCDKNGLQGPTLVSDLHEAMCPAEHSWRRWPSARRTSTKSDSGVAPAFILLIASYTSAGRIQVGFSPVECLGLTRELTNKRKLLQNLHAIDYITSGVSWSFAHV